MTDFADTPVPDAPQAHDLSLLRALAADLAAVDYTVEGVAGFLGYEAYAALGRDQLVPALLAARRVLGGAAGGKAPAALAAAVGLWLLGLGLPGAELDAALPSVGTRGLLELGLVEAGDGGYRAAVDLRPYASDAGGGLWVASDLGAHQRPGVLRHDHVLGIGQASLTLAQLTIRTPVDTALDLGTGCGIQAFHLLGHARRVIATDISARALAFTRFNLLLNAGALGIDPEHPWERIELRLGSLLDPVAGESFDLVVSNPPFVITPRSAAESAADQFTYRDGGLAGDDIVSTLVRTLPSVLAPGGQAQMLGNWEIPAGPDDGGPAGDVRWHSRPRGWVPAGIDAWFIQREQLSPAQYAETWLRDASENRDRDLFESAYADYLADFASRGVGAVGFGMIWLRRPDPGRPGAAGAITRFEEITYPIEQPIGAHLAAAIRRTDWLDTVDLAAEHLLVAGDVTEERHQRPGAEHPGVILLRQGAGLRRTNLMSTELAGFVSACDGDLSAGQIIGALAVLLDRADPGFAGGLLAEIHNLVIDGFLHSEAIIE